MVSPPKNYTNLRSGEQVKLRCEAEGEPPPQQFRWFHNERPLAEEKGKLRIKEGGGARRRWSQVRFRSVEVMNTGVYRCKASNAAGDVVSAEAFLKVHMASKWDDDHYDDEDDRHLFSEDDDGDYEYDDEYAHGLIPHTFPLDFGTDLSGGVDGLPDHMQYGNSGVSGGGGGSGGSGGKQRGPSARGRVSPPSSAFGGGGGGGGRGHGGQQQHLPNLKPTEHSGSCQRYTGTICHGYVGSDLIFVSDGLTQDHIEKMLQASLKVISSSSELSAECAKYAVPAICLSTLPPCDRQTRKPRKVREAFGTFCYCPCCTLYHFITYSTLFKKFNTSFCLDGLNSVHDMGAK